MVLLVFDVKGKRGSKKFYKLYILTLSMLKGLHLKVILFLKSTVWLKFRDGHSSLNSGLGMIPLSSRLHES